jgi:hypothetical protein
MMTYHTGKDSRRFKCGTCGACVTDFYLRKPKPTGEELLMMVASVLPTGLPSEIREEAGQAIVLDLLRRKVTPETLKDPRLVRRYVRAAYGLQDSFRFHSLDAPVNDGACNLGDLIAA